MAKIGLFVVIAYAHMRTKEERVPVKTDGLKSEKTFYINNINVPLIFSAYMLHLIYGKVLLVPNIFL